MCPLETAARFSFVALALQTAARFGVVSEAFPQGGSLSPVARRSLFGHTQKGAFCLPFAGQVSTSRPHGVSLIDESVLPNASDQILRDSCVKFEKSHRWMNIPELPAAFGGTLDRFGERRMDVYMRMAPSK